MNWIIQHSTKMPHHTYLDVIVKSFKDRIDEYNWIICDVEYNSTSEVGVLIDMKNDYIIFSPQDFKLLVNSRIQFWWGIILAVPIAKEIKLDNDNLPHAEFNRLVWKNGNLQYHDAEIEIICLDSSYTIVKFTKQDISDKFKNFFAEDAIPLEKFK